MFGIHLCCFDMHEPLLALLCAFNQDASMWLDGMFTDGVKAGKRAGGNTKRDDERDVKHKDDVGGTKRI